ncbi:MAG: 3-phosphoshikimate 1-carboxyvinyltransferase [Candidatus Lindowbacteria bacterium RIFCSPLOWO2_12_FULL_62_27]|nr:MAG: 3-phosphoshikimate 1-carboxyvinyltransferase [Candidatus Lindowbacteria bacterium RIFCSPLOWO2_12_FULL_62_27]OGH63818.1 MAG: 3-phosphoshikimate 1-carboxyvinyltransferase [Candidatus Lindowbacteria bacterium RIFCSPLOWO2_02_FULL_62_12]
MIRLTSLVPDKSISHRAALLAALSKSDSRIDNFSPAGDCLKTVKALQDLGCPMQMDRCVLTVAARTSEIFAAPSSPIDLGNSGTGMRLLLGVLAGQPIRATLTGDDSLKSRPMDRVAKPLGEMGARIEGTGDRVLAPVTITGARPLKPIRWRLEPASAQVKSAILLAGLYADGETVIEEPVATRDHTERMLTAAGVGVTRAGGEIRLRGGASARLQGLQMRVPDDFSAAAFFIALGLLADRMGGIEMHHVGLNPTRTAFLDTVRLMGGNVTAQVTGEEAGEPVGIVTARPSDLRGIEVPVEWVPNLIDEIPILSILAAAASGRTVVRGARELRVKESDRIKSIVQMVAGFSGSVEEREDGFEITGRVSASGAPLVAKFARFPTFADHRIAMSVLIAAETAGQAVTVDNTDCINTSFPGFFDCLGEIHVQCDRH